jgi:astacin (peptidase family M12A)/FG-GAP repeat protein
MSRFSFRSTGKKSIAGVALAILSSASACMAPEDADDDAAGAPDAGAPAWAAEGSQGSVRVRTPQGTETLTYVVQDGRAIHEGDIDLGPVDQLLLRGGAANLGDRWEENVAYFRLSSNLTGQVCEQQVCRDPRDVIRETLEEMSRQLPIKLVEDVDHTHDDYILYRYVDLGFEGGRSDSIGMAGGERTVYFSNTVVDGHHTQPKMGTLRHETLHALGLWHEQSRFDRDFYVDIDWGCIDPDHDGNYEQHDESADVGPYDYGSIMHYGPNSFCEKGDDDVCDCDHPIMSPKVLGAVIEHTPTQGGFSVEDVNTLYRMYAHTGLEGEANDAYGRAVAMGDFDDDGYADLAVGIPSEDVRDSDGWQREDAGAVALYRGTAGGPVAWKVLTEAALSGNLSDRAHFGRALAALDFDADGITDLAVGAPGESGSPGYVMIFHGSREHAPAATRMITEDSLGYAGISGSHFGFALAAGPVTGASRNGIPFDALAIGVPDGFTEYTASKRTGVVYVVQNYIKTNGTLGTAKATRLVPMLTPATGDNFGAAVAVGDLDGDGKEEVVVGAPQHANNAGRIYVYAGRLPPEASPASWSAMATPASSTGGLSGSRFGAALALGNIKSAGGNELAVGAPGGSGFVRIMNGGTLSPSTTKTLVDVDPEAGDDFGAALAIGNFDPLTSNADLLVGAPGENTDRGAIVMFLGGDLEASMRFKQSNADPGTVNEPGDRFGAALAIGNLDGRGPGGSTASGAPRRPDIAIGVPGEQRGLADDEEGPPGAGAVTLMRGTSSTPDGWRTIMQEFTGRLAD